jgi:hypothetical protein
MTRTIEVIVRLEVDDSADISAVIRDMDYDFTHPAIREMEIVDVSTEL